MMLDACSISKQRSKKEEKPIFERIATADKGMRVIRADGINKRMRMKGEEKKRNASRHKLQWTALSARQ
jgi:hypothetical protein